MKKHIVVMGAGAIGGYAGAHMARAGHDVTFVDPWPEHVEMMRNRGMRIRGVTPEEGFEIKLNAIHITEMQKVCARRPIDVAFLSVKSYDTAWAACLLKQYLSPSGFVVSLQNCINEETIASVVGWGRTMGTVIPYLAVELTEAGQVQRNVARKPDYKVFIVGETHGRVTDRAKEVAELLSAADGSKVTTNLWGERWSKLVINAMRNGLSAATGLNGNQRDLTEPARSVSIRLGSQAVRVGQALGYQLEPMMGMDADTLVRAGEGDQQAYHQIATVLENGARGRSEEQRPSMAQDIFKGRRTETDFINGYIAAKGREIGVNAELHESVHQIVKRVERGDMKPSVDHIRGL